MRCHIFRRLTNGHNNNIMLTIRFKTRRIYKLERKPLASFTLEGVNQANFGGCQIQETLTDVWHSKKEDAIFSPKHAVINATEDVKAEIAASKSSFKNAMITQGNRKL